MTTTAEQFLLGAGGKSASFPTVGTTVTGTIVDPAPKVAQQTDMSGNPMTWDNGDPRLQLVVTLQTQERGDVDDDGIRKLYVKGSKDPKSKSLHAAVAAAVQTANAKGLEVGGTLSVTYVGDGVASTRGFNPPKLYEARYTAPDHAAAAGEFLGTDQGQVNTATGEIQQQPAGGAAPQDGPAQPTAEQLAAVRSAGVDPKAAFPHWNGQG